MNKRLLLALLGAALLGGCAASYSGYKSKCACDFESLDQNNLETV